MAPYDFSREDLLHIILLSIPLIGGGILHMVAVKTDILSYLKKPIHQRWFGQNKTWRGFFIMPLATWPGVLISQELEKVSDLSYPLFVGYSSIYLAVVLGTAYCLAELPNSFLKRRIGIKEGESSAQFKVFFIILDQADSVIGCLIAYSLMMPLKSSVLLGLLLFGTLVHLFINFMLYSLKLRKQPF